MKVVTTACTRDCPGACSILAYVDNGKVVKLRGNPDHEITGGFLCDKAARYLEERLYNPERIVYPMRKQNGDWIRISWKEAIDLAASYIKSVIKKYGSLSILYYQGYGSRTALRLLNRRFFNTLGGVSTLYGTLCSGTGVSGQELDFGVRISHDPLDHLNSKVIIIWGRNPAVTDIHLWRILKKAKKKGAILVTIDPIETKTAEQSDIFIQPAPGSDIYLAMALSKIILRKGLVDWNFIKKNTQKILQFTKGF